MNKRTILLTLFITLSISFWSCQKSEMPVETNTSSTSTLQKTFVGATLKINVEHIAFNTDEYQYYELWIQNISTPWEEMSATWLSPWANNGGDYYHPTPKKTHHVFHNTYTLPHVYEFDITPLWTNGVPPNGIILRVDNAFGGEDIEDNDKRIMFTSSEGGIAPEVVVMYSDAPDETIHVIGDTWISNRTVDGNDYRDDNFGGQDILYAGKINDNAEKRTLLKFPAPRGGCTLTQGYWKTHAKYNKKKYDPTWGKLSNGANTVFFSGDTYIEVLWTNSKGGNEYIILAHQYIAAELNQLNDASIPPDAESAFNQAAKLFNGTETADRSVWITLSEILDDYNNGLIGPGHCDD